MVTLRMIEVVTCIIDVPGVLLSRRRSILRTKTSSLFTVAFVLTLGLLFTDLKLDEVSACGGLGEIEIAAATPSRAESSWEAACIIQP